MRVKPRTRLLLALVPVLAVAAWPLPASAHATVVLSHPQPGERLGSAPGVVQMVFSEPLNRSLSRAEVVVPSGRRVDSDPVQSGEIQVQLTGNEFGVYTVNWTTVSALDGHVLHGTFNFGVGIAPGASNEGGGMGLSPTDLLVGALRWVEYVGLLSSLGMLLIIRLAANPPKLQWVRPRLQLSLAVALTGGAGVVIAETLNASPSISALLPYLMSGPPGWARAGRVAAEAAALALAFTRARGLVAPAVVGASIALAAAGHAAAVRPAIGPIFVDAVHVLSAGLWAGGILALATLRPPGGWLGVDGRALLGRFSRVALIAFALTALSGVLRALEELTALGNLINTQYGLALTAKSVAVIAMLVLSTLAWRRLLPAPRAEAAVVAFVVAATALLAAYPLPPARFAEAEAIQEGLQSSQALPKDGDLTMGGDAGNALVGLTLRPGKLGTNSAWVFVLPAAGDAAAAEATVDLVLAGTSQTMRLCGATCRTANIVLAGGDSLEVRVSGSTSGSVSFALPPLPAPSGSAIALSMRARMESLKTLRIDETLRPGRVPLYANFAFQAPDRVRYDLSTGASTIIVGGTRYSRGSPGAQWVAEPVMPEVIPSFAWDGAPITAASIVSAPQPAGAEAVISFFELSGAGPIWFRLTVGADDLVHQVQMRAQAHFMDQVLYDFNAPFVIAPPLEQGAEGRRTIDG